MMINGDDDNWMMIFFLNDGFFFMHRIEENGGKIMQKCISRLAEFDATKYNAVFNCTGLGAKKLCNDVKVVPIRGQIIKVHAPWVKTAFYADYGI